MCRTYVGEPYFGVCQVSVEEEAKESKKGVPEETKG